MLRDSDNLKEKGNKSLDQYFNGPDYVHERDSERLSKQHEIIKKLMLDGRWRTLGEIEKVTGYPQSSISAQLRHMRKPRFGSYTVEKRYLGNGLFEYRLSI